jgi:hypothetical protein
MDVKTFVTIEIRKNDRVFSFNMPAGSPFGEAYDACYETLGHIIEFSQKAAEQARQAQTEDGESKIKDKKHDNVKDKK